MTSLVEEDNLDVKSVIFRFLHQECRRAPLSFELRQDEVHLWKAPITMAGSAVGLLTREERDLLEPMTSKKRRGEFMASRVIIKRLAGRYLDIEPQSIVVKSSQNERPEIAALKGNTKGLYFAWSHSHDLFVCAIARQTIGVDVELITSINQYPKVRGLLQQCLPVVQTDSINLARYWTACEALYKLRGTGTLREILREDAPPLADSATICGYHLRFGDHIIAVAGHGAAAVHCYSLEQDGLLVKDAAEPRSSL